MKENIFSKTLKLEIFNFSDYLIDNPYIRYILESWYSTIFGRKKLEKDHPVDVSDLTCWKSDAEDTVYRPIAPGWYWEFKCGFPRCGAWRKDLLCINTVVYPSLDCGLMLTYKIYLSLTMLLFLCVCMMSLFGQVPRHVCRIE